MSQTVSQQQIEKIAIAYEAFGFDLLAHLAEGAAGDNILISPLSIAIALTMTYNGAKAQTAQILAAALGITEMPLAQVNNAVSALQNKLENQGDQVQLTLANSLWVKAGAHLDSDFVQTIQTAYSGEVGSLNTAADDAAKVINRWVSNKTQGKIKTLVSDNMLRNALIVVLNAVYFKGLWAAPFKPQRTKEREFTLADGTTKLHPMMSRTGRYRYCDTDLFQAVCLPYANEQTSLYVFLPHESGSLASFGTQLTAKNWQHWQTQFKSGEVSLELPRFKIQYDCQLKKTLSALGLQHAFSPEANFEGIGAGALMISDVIHRAVIEVNETGSEAAAATAVMMVRSTPRRLSIKVNRPFFYAIRDDSLGVISFIGVIVDPAP